MSIRFRSWFFQVTKTALKKGVRFRTDDKPTQDTFKDLLDSIIFKSEANDRAKVDTGAFSESTVGHVVLATDSQTRANTVQPSDRSLVAQPHQTTTLSSVSDTIGTYTGNIIEPSLTAETSRKNYGFALSTGFKNWLLARLLPSGGTTSQVLTKISNTDFEFNWASIVAPSIPSINWSENLTDASNVLAVKNTGYVAEGGVVSLVSLPILSSGVPPVNNDRIGIAANEDSGVEIRLDGSSDPYFVLDVNQSAIFRYDSSLSKWLVESSHLPSVAESSTTIYVDAFATPGGTGSNLLPFNTFEAARDYIIGSGTSISPEFTNMVVIATAGTFNIEDENLWVNTITYSISENVIINFSTAVGLVGSPVFLFENSVGSFSSVCTVTGGATFNILSAGAGLVNAIGTNITASSVSNYNNKIEMTFNKVVSLVTHSIASASLIKAYCATEENNGNSLLVIDADQIIGGNSTPVVDLGQGAVCSISNATITSYFDTVNRDKLSVKIDSIYSVSFTNCIIGSAGASKHIFITGACDTIRFTDCEGYVYNGGNSSLYTNNIIKLDSSFSLTNKFTSAKTFGLFLTGCYTTNSNFQSANNSDSVYGYFIFKRDAGDTTFVSFTADVSDLDVSGLISTYVNSYLSGTGSGTPVAKFKTNIIGFNLSFDKTIKFDNIPTVSTGLTSGMVWNNGGVLNIV